jgi:hypothetical protein
MNKYFHMSQWKGLIPWDKFTLAGGSVLACLSSNPFCFVEGQDLDFFSVCAERLMERERREGERGERESGGKAGSREIEEVQEEDETTID